MDLLPDRLEWWAVELGLLLAVALVVSAAGFLRVVYFVSLGYAFSISAMAVLTAARFFAALDVFTALQCALLLAYGLRLGGFLVWRERSPAYQKELVEVEKRGAHIHGGLKAVIWVGVALLYVLMFSPALFVLALRQARPEGLALVSQWVGVPTMVAGLLLESWADRQKSAFKARAPARFCDVGLFAWVRCPNYLGEVVFWVGAWVAGFSAFTSVAHWALATVGFVCIVLVMLGSTRRLELKQDERYAHDPAYAAYTASVPVLFPFVPVFSFKRLRVYLG